MARKGIDNVFLHYGIRKEDMELIEQSCRDNDIDAEWLKESVLKAFHDERNSQNNLEDKDMEKEITKILKKAIKNVPV